MKDNRNDKQNSSKQISIDFNSNSNNESNSTGKIVSFTTQQSSQEKKIIKLIANGTKSF